MSATSSDSVQQLVRLVGRPLVSRLWRIEQRGFEHVPTTGPAIICANHASFFDAALLAFTLPRPTAFIGKAEYMKAWPTRQLFPAMGMIPIDRTGGAASTSALDQAADVLARGGLITIFPEGTRSRNGKLGRGHTGAARLAQRVGCPIVPVGISGTAAIQPPGAMLPNVGKRATVDAGPSIDPSAYADDDRALRTMTDDVMSAIQALCGRLYVDAYHRSPDVDRAQAAPEPTGFVNAHV